MENNKEDINLSSKRKLSSEQFLFDDPEIAEEIPIELLKNDIVITDQEEKLNKILEVKEVEGNLLNGETLIITAKGLVGGLRNRDDGIAFFGIEEANTQKTDRICDFILNVDEEYKKIAKNPVMFFIYFRRDFSKYYIRKIPEHSEKFFIFVLLQNYYKITGDILISTNKLHFQIRLSDDDDLKIECIEGTNVTQTGVFKKEQKTIAIGRRNDLDMVINDTSISREQLYFVYDEENEHWFVKDGNVEKGSANGSWLFVEKNYQIKDDCRIKIGTSTFEFRLKSFSE